MFGFRRLSPPHHCGCKNLDGFGGCPHICRGQQKACVAIVPSRDTPHTFIIFLTSRHHRSTRAVPVSRLLYISFRGSFPIAAPHPPQNGEWSGALCPHLPQNGVPAADRCAAGPSWSSRGLTPETFVWVELVWIASFGISKQPSSSEWSMMSCACEQTEWRQHNVGMATKAGATWVFVSVTAPPREHTAPWVNNSPARPALSRRSPPAANTGCCKL